MQIRFATIKIPNDWRQLVVPGPGLANLKRLEEDKSFMMKKM